MKEFVKIAFFILAVPLSYSDSISQVSNIKHDLSNVTVPSSIMQPGKIVNATSWSDDRGNNLLILSESFTSAKSSSVNRSAGLYAAHYLEANGDWVLQWKVEDYEKNCPLDVGATFIPDSVEITDLDSNGHAEVSFMYRVFCTGGVDPQTLKLIMYEKKKKYAIRGETLIRLPEQPAYGGDTRIDVSMKSAPYEFQKFALNKWNRLRVHPLSGY